MKDNSVQAIKIIVAKILLLLLATLFVVIINARSKNNRAEVRTGYDRKRLTPLFDSGTIYRAMDEKKIAPLDSSLAWKPDLLFIFVLGLQEWGGGR